MTPDRLERLAKALGTVLWLLVGATVVCDRGGGSLGVWWPSAWVAGFLLHLLSRPADRGVARRLLPLAGQVSSVLVMVTTLCHGFEGLLLIPVALQLSFLLRQRWAMTVVAVQTAALGVAIAIHWSARPAWMLALPYGVLQALMLFTGVTLRREAAARAELEQAHQQLRALAPLLEEGSRNAERVRLSRELHDAAGHQVTALALQLEVVRNLSTGAARAPIETARAITRELLDQLQTIVRESQQVDGEALTGALRAVASQFPRPEVHLSLPDGLRVADAERAHVLLRCSQEILTNSAKHSGASALWIRISQSDSSLELVAEDDGSIRMPLAPRGGLRGMRGRIEALGGTLALGRSERGGLGLKISLPNSPS